MKSYKYCPICQRRLIKRKKEGMPRLTCEECGWTHYMNPLPSVAALVFDGNRSRILLVKRGEAPRRGAWALPTGFLEQNETCEHAVIRELKEETGLGGVVKRLVNVHCERTTEYGSIVLVGYEMTPVHGRPRPGSDSLAVKYFPLNKLPQIPFNSHRRMIADALKVPPVCYIEILKSKITEARITGTQLFYRGSMGIDSSIMEAVGIIPGEKVHVLNYSNGERLETYTIPEKAGSGKFILYGPASRKGKVGDKLCILSYQMVEKMNAPGTTPRIAVLDERNRLKRKHT